MLEILLQLIQSGNYTTLIDRLLQEEGLLKEESGQLIPLLQELVRRSIAHQAKDAPPEERDTFQQQMREVLWGWVTKHPKPAFTVLRRIWSMISAELPKRGMPVQGVPMVHATSAAVAQLDNIRLGIKLLDRAMVLAQLPSDKSVPVEGMLSQADFRQHVLQNYLRLWEQYWFEVDSEGIEMDYDDEDEDGDDEGDEGDDDDEPPTPENTIVFPPGSKIIDPTLN